MNKKIIIAIIGVIPFSAGIVVAALYTQTFDPSWNPFADSPEQVIEKTIENMKALESMSSDVGLLLKTTDEKMQQNFTATINASSDMQENPNKTQGKFDINFAIEGMSFSLAGDVISIEEDVYLKLKTIPMLPFLAPLLGTEGIDKVNDLKQWIKFENEDIGGNMEQEDKVKKEEMEQKIKDLFLNKKLYFVKQELPNDKINDKNFYHYLVSLDKEELKIILLELSKILEGEKHLRSLSRAEDFEKSLDEFFEKIGDIEADVWIGKKDKLLYRIEFKKTIDAANFDGDENGVINIGLKINFSKFNESSNIEAPNEFKTIEEIFSATSKFESPGMEKSNDASVIADMSQMRTVAEIMLDDEGSYTNVSCNYGDVNMLCDEIKEMTGDKPTIHSSKKVYCAYVKLNSGEYYCIDHTLKAIKTSTNPAQKGYCDGITFICP